MSRLRLAAPILVVGLLTSGFLVAQDKKGDSKEPIVVRARLPANYNKLGLSDKQKKEIYKIRGKYALKLEELQQQIAALRDQEKTDVEKVLTEAQKLRLKEIQTGAAGEEKKEAPPEGRARTSRAKSKSLDERSAVSGQLVWLNADR
jgi:hypothetical protein